MLASLAFAPQGSGILKSITEVGQSDTSYYVKRASEALNQAECTSDKAVRQDCLKLAVQLLALTLVFESDDE